MDEILKNSQITPSHLVVIIALLTCHLLFKMGMFAWDIVKKKDESSSESLKALSKALSDNLWAIEKLEMHIQAIQKDLNELPKIKKDLIRVFTAAKILAGSRWGDIRKEFDDL